MVDEATEARIAALEAQVAMLKNLAVKLLPAVVETARISGVRRRHTLLIIAAVQAGILNPDEFDGDG